METDNKKQNAPALAEGKASLLTPWGAVHYSAGRSVEERLHDYEGFIRKFSGRGKDAPRTTDECLTPPRVFAAVVEWVAARVPLDGRRIVRPFYPGGDYEKYPYQPGDVVIDNPPFSILSRIRAHYQARGIAYFLFAPGLTVMSTNKADGDCAVLTGNQITYANGAKVNTAFCTSLFPALRALVAPSLRRALARAEAEGRAEMKAAKPRPPKYVYPHTVWSAAALGTLARRAVDDVPVPAATSCRVFGQRLEQQMRYGKSIYGGGLFVDRRTGEELAETAARTVAETAARPVAETVEWELSPDETDIIDALDDARAALDEAGGEHAPAPLYATNQ